MKAHSPRTIGYWSIKRNLKTDAYKDSQFCYLLICKQNSIFIKVKRRELSVFGALKGNCKYTGESKTKLNFSFGIFNALRYSSLIS